MSVYKDLLETMVKALVNNADKVEIEEEINENVYKLSFSVDPSDNGKVIGKQGGNFRCLRKLLASSARKDDNSVQIKFNPIKPD